MDSYSPSTLVRILHSFPHLTFKFVLLQNPAFTVDSSEYLESLAILALMPIVILLLTMVGFLFYYCCVAVKRATPNKNNSSACYCSVCMMTTFIMLTLGGVSVGIYGSIQCNEGMRSAIQSTNEINQSFSTITDDVQDISMLLSEVNAQTNQLFAVEIDTSGTLSLQESLSEMSDKLDFNLQQTEGANDRVEWTIELLRVVENYRTIITFSLLGVIGLVCLLGLAGVCFRSKCLLVTTTFIGLMCLVICYIYIGCDFMVDVAVADLCMDPYTYVRDQAVSKLYMNEATANYYLNCSQEIGSVDPFASVVEEALDAVQQFSSVIESYDTNKEEKVNSIMALSRDLTTELNSLSGHLGCKSVNKALDNFIPAICTSMFEGLFILICSVLSCCLALTAVLCAAPKTWKRFSKQSGNNDSDLDLDDVFLPPTNVEHRPVISRTNNPLYVAPEERYSRRISSNLSTTNLPAATNTLSFFRRSEENVNLLDQQPPPYSPPKPGSRFAQD
ncbi:protein tweety homolog 3 [Ciona intestinalis]